MSHVVTIPDVIRSAGGPAAIIKASEAAGTPITRDAVYKWRQTGIPDRHWPVLIGLTDLHPDDLYAANCAVRNIPARIIPANDGAAQ